MAFTRTPRGLAEKWRFHQLPTVWIEGPTDLYFYKPISDGISCRFEPFHGYINAESLINALRNNHYPYLVILDGDYRILNRSRAPHRSVLILSRYSFENFLWEPYAVNNVCCLIAGCGEEKDLVSNEMEAVKKIIRKELLDAISLDVAARDSSHSPVVLPKSIEALLKTDKGIKIDTVKVKELISNAKRKIDHDTLEKANYSVETFLKTRCITHLLKGHLLFGLLRRIFNNAVACERGKVLNIRDEILKQLISAEVWKHCGSDDHKHLKRSYRIKLRKIVRQFFELKR